MIRTIEVFRASAPKLVSRPFFIDITSALLYLQLPYEFPEAAGNAKMD